VLAKGVLKKARLLELEVFRSLSKSIPRGPFGLWLTGEVLKKIPTNRASQIRWWLPPVIWPENEEAINAQVQAAVKKGARHFVLNAPWQIGFFKTFNGLDLWAGPFCNLANPLAVAALKTMGFSGAIVSPELGAEDFMQLPQQSPMPLGIVLAGSWPLCVARTVAQEVQLNQPFASPRGEQAWATRHGTDYYVYPNWTLDLRAQKKALQNAGYTLLVNLIEPVPKTVKLRQRPGLWNWETKLQ